MAQNEAKIQENQGTLLGMASRLENRPKRGTYLGTILTKYLTNYPDFKEEIKKLNPEWFEIGPKRSVNILGYKTLK